FFLSILKPDGSALALPATPSCGGSAFRDRLTLPVSGTYTLLLDPVDTGTGNATLAVYTFVDVTGPITADGTSVPVTISAPGQNAGLTFAGTAGQVVSASATNTTIPGNCNQYAFWFAIVRPDGINLATTNSCGGSVFLTQKTLP